MTDEYDFPDAVENSFELHIFELDIHYTAIMNLKHALDGIDKAQQEGADYIYKTQGGQTLQHILAMPDAAFYDALRSNAYRLAVVALVTRFQHWIGLLMNAAPIKVSKKRNDPSMLVLQLRALNHILGDGPVPLEFFDELEEVRNSVIHADSQAEWQSQGKRRKIASRYINGYGEVDINDGHIQQAVTKMIQQMKWYESQLHEE